MDYFGFTETQRFVKRAENILGADILSELQFYICADTLTTEMVELF